MLRITENPGYVITDQPVMYMHAINFLPIWALFFVPLRHLLSVYRRNLSLLCFWKNHTHTLVHTYVCTQIQSDKITSLNFCFHILRLSLNSQLSFIVFEISKAFNFQSLQNNPKSGTFIFKDYLVIRHRKDAGDKNRCIQRHDSCQSQIGAFVLKSCATSQVCCRNLIQKVQAVL